MNIPLGDIAFVADVLLPMQEIYPLIMAKQMEMETWKYQLKN